MVLTVWSQTSTSRECARILADSWAALQTPSTLGDSGPSNLGLTNFPGDSAVPLKYRTTDSEEVKGT